ncbi:AMP-binding protein [Chelatococcus reniformis]|uniref:3-methylmercaptopropionyl-CoA ligase n=1 Tax=Chelatococcus reniformis TaxID=1494448 RepID=A0A916XJV1_9HYPH|nr:AMP-binding protein [Chelatococcus reniformis]GGC77415.1 AMP-dependent synthetase [Chelatococcus reniformis]
MNLASLLFAVARTLPDRPAVTDGRGTLSYGQWIDRVARIAFTMAARGARPGDRVALYMENCGEFLEVLAAAWTAGLVAVPINAKLHVREVAFIIENCAARLLFTTPGLLDDPTPLAGSVADLRVIQTGTDDYRALLGADRLTPRERAGDDPAWIFYTSGTTGRPKGAVLTHRNLIFMSNVYYADIDQIDARDTKLHAAPMSHGSGLYGLPHLLKGSHQVIQAGFDVERIFEALEQHRNLTFFAAPTMLTRLINHADIGRAKIQNLKTIYYGGGPTYRADLRKAVEIFGPRLFQLFGQGESPMTITGLAKTLHGDDELLATCGVARSGVEVRVADDDGNELPVGEVGEVLTRSDCVMKEYLGNAEATASALQRGWLHTGDLGSLDERGFLTLRDRSKDMIISGGTNIYPREVEEVLLLHPAVLEVSVIGRPHADWGEEVVAVIACVPGQSATEGELDALCLAHIARFKRPKLYRFVAQLPKNNYGKILKTELRQQLLGEEAIP